MIGPKATRFVHGATRPNVHCRPRSGGAAPAWRKTASTPVARTRCARTTRNENLNKATPVSIESRTGVVHDPRPNGRAWTTEADQPGGHAERILDHVATLLEPSHPEYGSCGAANAAASQACCQRTSCGARTVARCRNSHKGNSWHSSRTRNRLGIDCVATQRQPGSSAEAGGHARCCPLGTSAAALVPSAAAFGLLAHVLVVPPDGPLHARVFHSGTCPAFPLVYRGPMSIRRVPETLTPTSREGGVL